MQFIYESRRARVVFEQGSIDLAHRELSALGCRRALILCTPEQQSTAESVRLRLRELAAGVFAQAAMHVPIATVHTAREAAARLGADCTVAVGGGSAIGLAKALALAPGLPILAIPTTYAGSEMTPIYGITEGRLKRTGRHERVLPRCVLYDPSLFDSLPARVAAASGLNAIAHAAEGLYAHDGNPVIGLMAEEGIRALAAALPRLEHAGQHRAARTEAIYGAWLCATVLGSVAMGLHHKLCHTLGGSYALPHAETHAVMLPHTLAYNAAHAPDAMRRIARALGCHDAAQGLYALQAALDVPRSLKSLGMQEADLEQAAALAVQQPYPNPRPLERQAIQRLLERAYEGAAPG